MDRVDAAFTAAWTRWQQLEMGTVYDAPDAPRAAALERRLKEAHARRKAGTLDGAAFVRWACGEVPWLARVLGDEPEPPRRLWVPPPPPVPAPTPAHAAVAARILRGDVAR